ncbi:glycosyltransferase family 2 protein [Nodularia harveyana UHCC-0300]|uniref:Glycosyltransferase family 2 protein n=1 Tax=Nodularia harveyana UHCC-0300 TaxID=2974287 RepID=A0ABU5UDZ5_9CYAN|nr:glycosyltransferase family 2 protein [Nodularia harveyana]MEA5580681.1 glycosyltransferase family 2 protein [Nodularia harveyana UHCC-0300]
MTKNPPKLSVGLPVYNGEKYIKAALDSLLAQSFTDFELIISDNASTDNTEAICRAYAAEDKRIRYYRNQNNLGCSHNFNRVFDLSVGEYFKWAAYDDLHAPDFLIKCVEVLDDNPSVILCHSHVYFIDENGDFLQNYNIKLKTDSPKHHERFHELLTKHFCYQMYGVIRASALRKVPPMGSYGTADGILLLRLGLLGEFYEIPEYLFFARLHSQQSLSMFFPDYHLLIKEKGQYTASIFPNFYAYTVWFDSAKKGRILFPHWRILWEYILSVWLFKLTFYQRIRCHFSIYQQLQGAEYLLLKDLFKATQAIFGRWFLPKVKPTAYFP